MQVSKFFRLFLIFLISAIFVALLFSLTVSFSFSEITKPANSKQILFSMLASAMPKEPETSAMTNQIVQECQNKSELQLPLGEGNDSVTINCDDIRNNKPLNEALLDSLFNKIYYKEYGCSFLDCLKIKDAPPFFLFAKVSNDFFTKLNLKIIIAAIIAGIALILLGGIRKLANSLIAAGLPFIIVLFTKNSIMQQLSSRQELQPLIPLINSLDALSNKLFASFLALGIILLIISLIFHKREKEEKPKAKEGKPKQKAGKKK